MGLADEIGDYVDNARAHLHLARAYDELRASMLAAVARIESVQDANRRLLIATMAAVMVAIIALPIGITVTILGVALTLVYSKG